MTRTLCDGSESPAPTKPKITTGLGPANSCRRTRSGMSSPPGWLTARPTALARGPGPESASAATLRYAATCRPGGPFLGHPRWVGCPTMFWLMSLSRGVIAWPTTRRSRGDRRSSRPADPLQRDVRALDPRCRRPVSSAACHPPADKPLTRSRTCSSCKPLTRDFSGGGGGGGGI